MLRTAFVACLLALLVAAPAALAASTRTKILRECQEGRLTGNYTPSQIRDARNNIPDDIDQYSNCRDVLTRALLAGAADSGDGGNGGGPGGSGGSGSGGGGGGGERLTPSTDADRQALQAAATGGGQPLEIAGRKVAPGEGSVRNDLPTTLIVVLALLAVAAVGAAVPYLRRSAGRLTVLRRVIPGRSG
jgi:hypothetical protein